MIRYSILLNLFFSTPNIYTHTHTPRHQRYKLGVIISIQKMKIMAYGPITSWEMDGETVETVSDFIFWAPKSLQMVIAAMKLKDDYSLEEKL